MNLIYFGLEFEFEEPNVWDVVPNLHLSTYAVHCFADPWFAHSSDENYSGLNWQVFEGGCIRE